MHLRPRPQSASPAASSTKGLYTPYGFLSDKEQPQQGGLTVGATTLGGVGGPGGIAERRSLNRPHSAVPRTSTPATNVLSLAPQPGSKLWSIALGVPEMPQNRAATAMNRISALEEELADARAELAKSESRVAGLLAHREGVQYDILDLKEQLKARVPPHCFRG